MAVSKEDLHEGMLIRFTGLHDKDGDIGHVDGVIYRVQEDGFVFSPTNVLGPDGGSTLRDSAEIMFAPEILAHIEIIGEA